MYGETYDSELSDYARDAYSLKTLTANTVTITSNKYYCDDINLIRFGPTAMCIGKYYCDGTEPIEFCSEEEALSSCTEAEKDLIRYFISKIKEHENSKPEESQQSVS